MQSRNLINVFCHVYLALSANINFASSVRWAVGQLSFQQHRDLCFTAVLNSGSSIHWLYCNPTTAKTGWANVTKTRESDHDWGKMITACVESAAHSGSREGFSASCCKAVNPQLTSERFTDLTLELAQAHKKSHTPLNALQKKHI